MKQLLVSLAAVALFTVPQWVHATGSATMSLDASAYTIVRGELFDVTVSVDPHGEELDTVRAVLTFDPRVLKAQNVRLAGLFDRMAPGNYFDSETGKISWGAFTLAGPITAPTPFMTVTFIAIAQGEGSIEISPDSRAISDGEERIDTSALGEATVAVEDAPGAKPGEAVLALESSTHPDQAAWYASRKADVSWTALEGESPIVSYSYVFGLEAGAEPRESLDGAITELSLEALADGIYYFQIKGVQEDGRETPVASRVLRMDATLPNPINLSVQDARILEGESAWFIFATTDETSGVVEYQVSINDSEFQTQTSPLEMEDLPVGTYFFRVAAFDRAGNSSYGGTSVRVYPQGTDLSRAQGYEETGEAQSLATAVQQTVDENADSRRLLISLVLGALVILAIIYALRRRRRS